MKLILHIGAHKTGTSSIQEFLKKHSEQLLNHNWQLAYIDGVVNLGHCIGFEKEEEKVHFKFHNNEYCKIIEFLKSNNYNKIISSEDLFFLNNLNDIERFCKDISSIFDDIHFIVYLRNQVEMACSNKAQGAKTDQSAFVFGNYYQNPLPQLNYNVLEYLDYQKKISIWKEFLPNSQYTIRAYNKKTMKESCSVRDFLDSTLIPLKKNDEIIEENPSLGSKTTNILHNLRMHNVLPGYIYELDRLGCFYDMGGIKQLPSKKEAIAFMAPFIDGNHEIEKLYGIELNLDLTLFPEKTTYQEITLDDAMQQMSHFINNIMYLRSEDLYNIDNLQKQLEKQNQIQNLLSIDLLNVEKIPFYKFLKKRAAYKKNS